jgi:hypothetical protein
MTEREQLERDIDTLRESIKLYGANIVRETPTEIQGTLKAIGWCQKELAQLEAQLKALKPLS